LFWIISMLTQQSIMWCSQSKLHCKVSPVGGQSTVKSYGLLYVPSNCVATVQCNF
jgi:hypothetical protein